MAQQRNEPIAIVGSACRFAGGINSPSQLWDILQKPRYLRQEIPSSRFNANGFFHPDGSYQGRTNVKHGYFVDDDLGAFDAEFFGIKPVEAQAIDPQQRFLLEVAYEALENAGIPVEGLKGSDTGVFVGAMFHDYGSMVLRDLNDLPVYTATGTGTSIMSNRLSYFFDWHGPSMTIDTACSSSLVAAYLAIQALRAGETTTALVCGSNLILGPENFIIESKLKMLSPNGLGRMWDHNADGYARGEGTGVLVLKTLRDALRDGDTIECVIREIAINQDGESNRLGITMPHAAAQEALIRKTYLKAGLDLEKLTDGPQFFEAHGTGTPAGDPVEAEAVYNAISRRREKHSRDDTPLYVGSIKTVLGHTEGTAGVAAIMKASRALRHGIIPPNLLFDQISDRVAPFYKDVEVPTVAKLWPRLSSGESETRRASVNCFGFGGTNAHAILESHTDIVTNGVNGGMHPPPPLFAPYVFSAFSDQSLRKCLEAYAGFLDDTGSEIKSRDLCWTLHNRRSKLPHRAAFPASSIQDLSANITTRLKENNNSNISNKGLSAGKTGSILGIFTGQGAQYPRMVADLVEKSAAAMKILKNLEESLAKLPDRPSWSLKEELLAQGSSSRVYEATISQPLCTAVQILLVDLLGMAGIKFNAVVGHSSGEIGAAYAAGYLTAEDAVRVAYYRGLHLSHASSPNGQGIKGAMLAVSSSREDLEELCQDPVFSGRISIAACNSPSSFTISGDEDAIEDLEILLEDEKKFNRRLRVDMAYHSDHMLPCSDPYVESLARAGVQSRQSSSPCTWVSSVYGRPVEPYMDLAGSYWAENLTCPVMFSQALETALAVADNSYDLVVELGAHPALKEPSTETVKHIIQRELPYTGLLSRSLDAITATSAALGFAWAHLESGRVNIDRYEKEVSGSNVRIQVVADLPTYCWNHDNRYWHESRISRRLRGRKHPGHPILGDATPDSAAHHMSWRNFLRVNEMEWISGHRVQGQIVFPAAGYLVAGLEAARFLAESYGDSIRLFEMIDFVVHHAMVFEREDVGTETLTELCDIVRRDGTTKRTRAKFTYSAALPNTDELVLIASAELEIVLGSPSATLLPVRGAELPHMVDVETNRFYAALHELGYEFSGRFKSLSDLKRRHFRSTCQIQVHDQDDFLIHPAELDASLQSCMLAFSYPYDGQLRTLHLPTTIQRFRVNPGAFPSKYHLENTDVKLVVDAAVDRIQADGRGLSGDVTLYSADTASHGFVQLQNAVFRPVAASEENDRKMFSKEYWLNMSVDGSSIAKSLAITEEHRKMHVLLERIATFYLMNFDRSVALDDPIRSQSPISHYLNFARHIASTLEKGQHRTAQQEWLHDTLETIMDASRPYDGMVDIEIMHLVGTQMPRVFRGETTMLEEFRASQSAGTGILDRYYAEAFGLSQSGKWISKAVAQIVDRYPHMNILEIGAGTGSATKAVFGEIGQRCRSYTYTDVSAAFFENASHVFRQLNNRTIFKTLDIEKSPLQQGYEEGTYDLVIAFFVIHATSDLERSLRNVRKLLRPGGFLVVGEGHEGAHPVASSGFIFGTLPGWWLGAGKDGRDLSPHTSPEEWGRLLRATGFSGADITVPESWRDLFNVYHFVAQAVDDQVQVLREPLQVAPCSSVWSLPPIEKLVILGGHTSRSSRFIDGLQSLLADRLSSQCCTVKALTDVDQDTLGDARTTVLSLVELDKPLFEDITPTSFEAIKKIFGSGKRLFWVTNGRLNINPYSNMTVGFARVAANESPDLRFQTLNIEDLDTTDPRTVAEIFLRFIASEFLDSRVLWSREPEIRIDGRGCQLFSRLRPVTELNDRYNSIERTTTYQTNIQKSPATLRPSSNGSFTIENLSTWELSVSEALKDPLKQLLHLHVSHATVSAIRTSLGYKFLVLGLNSEGAAFLSLVPSLASVLKVPLSCAVRINVTKGSERSTVAAVAAHLVASAILSPLCHVQTALIHNALNGIAIALRRQASARGINVIFSSDVAQRGASQVPSVRVPAGIAQVDLVDLLPDDAAVFANFGIPQSVYGDSIIDIASVLPEYCRIERTASLFSSAGSHHNPSLSSMVEKNLQDAIRFAQDDRECEENCHTTEPMAISLAEVTAGALPPDEPLAIIEFDRDALVPIQACRLDSRPMLKGVRSTYWVAGMTGALGISLCDWMIRNGARNIVVTSRQPEISPEWIAAHARKGSTVMVIPCDITVESEVITVYKRICESLPPVAGVINGAMVLRDVAIRNMSFDQLAQVLGPKVSGSIFLDRLFYTTDLDFFVLISSINCVIGSWGQANYAAANMFMCGLAAQRRKRGYRASTVNVGAIIGAGYMERESRRALDSIVQKLHMMRLSEEDWHQAVGEAIDASRLDSAYGPELTTGLSDVPLDGADADTPTWFHNPRYGEFVTYPELNGGDTYDTKAPASLQAIISACSTLEDLQMIISDAFANQLRSILQVNMSNDDLLSSRSSDLGIDSLVSVDIRSWAFKNLQVSIPVLMIMGNNTMESLVEYAVENMPPEMLPGLVTTSHNGSLATTQAVLEQPEASSSAVPHENGYVEDRIDWEAESSPSDDWTSIIPTSSSRAFIRNPPETIVLTGVTGLLGHHLLEHLLNHTSAKVIHCLAIRRLTTRLQNMELLQDPRVMYYPGNLSDPNLGLSDDEAISIFSSADVVIHNGADTSHVQTYSDLKASNVGSTKTLIRLCLPRRVPLHYISSAGVGIYYHQDVFPEVSLTMSNSASVPMFKFNGGSASMSTSSSSVPPGDSDGTFGYGCSKWVCELLLERTHAQFDLPVSIYRPSTIIREGADSSDARAQFDWVNSLLHYVRKLEAAPRMENNMGMLDLVHVGSCCDAVVDGIVGRSGRHDVDLVSTADVVRYANLVGDLVIPLQRLNTVNTGGKGYNTLPLRKWIERAVEAGLHPSMAMLIEEMDAPGRPDYPRLVKGQHEIGSKS